MNKVHNQNIHTYTSTCKSDILKTKGKLKFMRDKIADEYVSHTMNTRNMKSAH